MCIGLFWAHMLFENGIRKRRDDTNEGELLRASGPMNCNFILNYAERIQFVCRKQYIQVSLLIHWIHLLVSWMYLCVCKFFFPLVLIYVIPTSLSQFGDWRHKPEVSLSFFCWTDCECSKRLHMRYNFIMLSCRFWWELSLIFVWNCVKAQLIALIGVNFGFSRQSGIGFGFTWYYDTMLFAHSMWPHSLLCKYIYSYA